MKAADQRPRRTIVVRLSFPEAERACAEVLSLPRYAELTEAEVRRVAEAVRSAS